MINNKELMRIIEDEEEGTTLDYKEVLKISTEGEKANFIKDIVSLANSGEISHIIIGVEDGTRKPIGIKSRYKLETFNQILKDKIDPPLRIDYKEKEILHCLIGVIEINGSNAPYIISVPDRYGSICRGTVYVRNLNMNEGAVRADLDRIYGRKKPLVLEADVYLSSEVSTKDKGDFVDVDINFYLMNTGDALATDAVVFLEFENIKSIVSCGRGWTDETRLNKGRPCVSAMKLFPLITGVRYNINGCVVQVEKDTKVINTGVAIGASNMRTRRGDYSIYITDGLKTGIF